MDITNPNSTLSAADPLANFRVDSTTSTAQGSDELGENEFLTLLITQLENQSPLEPQDNGDFIAQLAQFTALEEAQTLNATVSSLSSQFQSSQALQGTALVGRNVLVPGSESPLSAGGDISGVVDLQQSTGDLSVSIFNASGELVNTIELGQQPAGNVPFRWDGTNAEGELVTPGQYSIRAEASSSGQTEQASTLLAANVNSVSIAQTGAITLNLDGLGALPLESVRQIN